MRAIAWEANEALGIAGLIGMVRKADFNDVVFLLPGLTSTAIRNVHEKHCHAGLVH